MEFCYSARARSGQTTRAPKRVFATHLRHAGCSRATCLASRNVVARDAASHPINGQSRRGGFGTDATLGSAGPRRTVGGSADYQGVGPDLLQTLKVSWLDGGLDGESVEVHNFLAKRGVKETEAGARRRDSYEAAVEMALADRGRGKNTTERPCEAGVHRGAELQMSQLVAHIRCKPKERGAARVRKGRALLSAVPHAMLSAALAQEAARSYLKPRERHLARAKPNGRRLPVTQENGVGNVKPGNVISSRGLYPGRPLDGARQSYRAKSVRALRELQNRDPGRDAGPVTMKELELN